MSILLSDFEDTAKRRLDDAMFLVVNDRYDSAVYLGGYALEIALKIVIARDYNLGDVPENTHECKNAKYSGKYIFTHDLNKLLRMSSVYTSVLANSGHKQDFDFVCLIWSPERRYEEQCTSGGDAFKVIEAIERLTRWML
jgi:hypothetical protein